MTPQERNTKILLCILIGIGILLILWLGFVITDDMRIEGEIYFEEVNDLPENAHIVKLTEEDYEKYPVLKDIPNIIYLDTSPLSEHFIIPGLVMRDTGWEIRETYGYQSGGRNRFIEHNGVIYRLEMHVS